MKICYYDVGHMTKMAATPIYSKKHLKNLENQWADFNETWYVALGTLGSSQFVQMMTLE